MNGLDAPADERFTEKSRPSAVGLYRWAVHPDTQTATFYRPVGPKELTLIEASGMGTFPPRLPEQPIFYPVLTEDHAVKIARDWNVRASGAGFATRFEVLKSFLDAYEVHEAGGQAHREYWIPAEELDAFNAAIVGDVEVVAEFR